MKSWQFVTGALCIASWLAMASCSSAPKDANDARAKENVAESDEILRAGGPIVMRRLTQVQYRNIVRDVFGDTVQLGGRFEPDIRVEHLVAVGAGQASITAAGLEQYDKIARSIGEQVVDAQHRGEMIECKPSSAAEPDDVCAKRFLRRVGRLLFRRALTEQELSAYVAGANAATQKTNDFYAGISLSLAGMLAAPQFLYRQEFTEADPAHKGEVRLTAYSKAQRLSFLLWNTAPDPALLTAAEKSEIHTERGLAKQVDRLLASARLESGVRAFFIDMLEFEAFDTLAKDATLYPKFTSAVAAQAQEQTLRTLVQLLIRENGDFRDIFTTRRTFLTPLLASLYRVPVQTPNGRPDEWVPYEFSPNSGQSGILTQASFVALHSHPGRSSPTLRGKALRELLLCTKVPDPPGDVNFTVVQDTSNPQYKTARARLKAHATEPMCNGCHRITDPIGLALESFDTTGGYRESENDVKIETFGDLNGVKFEDAAGLGKAVHDNGGAASCLVRRTYDYALGRVATKDEAAWRSKYLEKDFAAGGYRFPALLRSIATNETYYRIKSPSSDEKAQKIVAARGSAQPEKGQ